MASSRERNWARFVAPGHRAHQQPPPCSRATTRSGRPGLALPQDLAGFLMSFCDTGLANKFFDSKKHNEIQHRCEEMRERGLAQLSISTRAGV